MLWGGWFAGVYGSRAAGVSPAPLMGILFASFGVVALVQRIMLPRLLCPCCGRSFFFKASWLLRQSNLLARQCLHCRTPLGTTEA
jgi:hypothetical protein